MVPSLIALRVLLDPLEKVQNNPSLRSARTRSHFTSCACTVLLPCALQHTHTHSNKRDVGTLPISLVLSLVLSLAPFFRAFPRCSMTLLISQPMACGDGQESTDGARCGALGIQASKLQSAGKDGIPLRLVPT